MDSELEGTLSRLAKAERDGEAECERAQAEGRRRVDEARHTAAAIVEKARDDARLLLSAALEEAAGQVGGEERSIALEAEKKASAYSAYSPPKGLVDELVAEVGKRNV